MEDAEDALFQVETFSLLSFASRQGEEHGKNSGSAYRAQDDLQRCDPTGIRVSLQCYLTGR